MRDYKLSPRRTEVVKKKKMQPKVVIIGGGMRPTGTDIAFDSSRSGEDRAGERACGLGYQTW